MKEIYVLYYEFYEIDCPELDVEMLIGIYSSYDKALEGLITNKDKSEFMHNPAGLFIQEEKLNCSEWLEGFIKLS